MSGERIIPDVGHDAPVGGGRVFLAGMYDTLHYWEPLDTYWLRYYDGEDRTMNMIVLNKEGAQAIVDGTDIPICYRETIFESEHRNLVTVLGNIATDALFDLDIDEAAIIAELTKEGEGNE